MTGQTDRPPMGTALEQTAIVTARNAVIASMAALLQQRQTGEGQHIDVSMMEAVVSTPPNFIHQFSFTGAIAGRGFGESAVLDGMHLATSDSPVTLTTAGTGGNPMDTWATFLDEPRLRDPKFESRQGENATLAGAPGPRRGKLSQWKARDFMKEAMDQRLVVGVVQSPEEVVSCPHLAARGSFVGWTTLTWGHCTTRALDSSSTASTRWQKDAAPRLGEHNAVIYGGELGFFRGTCRAASGGCNLERKSRG